LAPLANLQMRQSIDSEYRMGKQRSVDINTILFLLDEALSEIFVG
jgi:hypothetical protein